MKKDVEEMREVKSVMKEMGERREMKRVEERWERKGVNGILW